MHGVAAVAICTFRIVSSWGESVGYRQISAMTPAIGASSPVVRTLERSP
jgi:hypothetical protein